ncbi:MAG TPA: fructosamine kinase family protein [Bacteroidales bacterium]|nr:fructosamine kinase family protein [Bacteroidales bacterium]HRZ49172.1 fructosamine kinase family protein [Bacteroidales bacterium]
MTLPQPLEHRMVALMNRLWPDVAGSLKVHYASGGSINEAATLSMGGRQIFVKWNDAGRYPGMFEAEALGLQLLADPGQSLVPAVLEQGEAGHVSYLALEYVVPGSAGRESGERFGEMLANLHRNTSAAFGLEHNNYMGSLPQRNAWHQHWNDFFISERLVPQLRIARDEGSLSAGDSRAFDQLFRRLPEIIPEEPPALVHGDLWSGNYLSGAGDRTWLVDPAVAYGHREVDIAMSKLFGGFPAAFYRSYNDHFPLQKGWETRLEIFQLYPLLIHVNLFGGGYVHSVRQILEKFR